MSPADLALSRRAVACTRWRWMPGMAFSGPVDDDAHMACYRYPGEGLCAENGVPISDLSGGVPDLADPATIGCLLGLVREVWGDPTAMASAIKGCDGSHDAWVCYVYPCEDRERRYLGATEAASLIAALEAAP